MENRVIQAFKIWWETIFSPSDRKGLRDDFSTSKTERAEAFYWMVGYFQGCWGRKPSLKDKKIFDILVRNTCRGFSLEKIREFSKKELDKLQ